MEPRVLDQLLAATALLQKDLARFFENTPLTTARTHLLWELRRLGSSTQQALAGALSVSARNITGLERSLDVVLARFGALVHGERGREARA